MSHSFDQEAYLASLRQPRKIETLPLFSLKARLARESAGKQSYSGNGSPQRQVPIRVTEPSYSYNPLSTTTEGNNVSCSGSPEPNKVHYCQGNYNAQPIVQPY